MEPGRLEEIDAIFQEAMTEALAEQNTMRREGEELTVDIELIGNRPSGKVAVDAPLIQRALAATRAVGAEPELSMGFDRLECAHRAGDSATTIGSGGEGFGAHSLHEWWANRDGHLGNPEGAAAGVGGSRIRGGPRLSRPMSVCEFDFRLPVPAERLLGALRADFARFGGSLSGSDDGSGFGSSRCRPRSAPSPASIGWKRRRREAARCGSNSRTSRCSSLFGDRGPPRPPPAQGGDAA